MERITWILLATALGAPALAAAEKPHRKLTPVPFTDVKVTDAFWAPRIETNRTKTVPHDFKKCEDTGRIRNFAKAAGRMEGKFEGIYFNDSDVYKVIEGAAYSLAAHPDPKLEKYLDDLIDTIAAAQQKNGYLFCFYTLKEPEKRWTNLRSIHELYCAGHFFEAAVAHYRATGKRSMLNVATRLADLIDSIFGPDKRHGVPGHEEIELALVKLYEVTGEGRYLNLAKFFLDERGRAGDRKLYGPYSQDHTPVIEQTEPVGHSVRAMYLYCGMADVAAYTRDKAYIAALDQLWANTATRKMYVTGGVGARHGGEAFGDDYELPNRTAYCETCAACGHAFWNHRMNLLHADAKYADILERVLYNGFLSGVSLDGEKFFYVNPLDSSGKHHRQAWFGCACCPTNVVRTLPSIPGYVCATDSDGITVNLYAASTARVKWKDATVTLKQQTRYPWDGAIRLTVEPDRPAAFTLALRIPAWSRGETATAGLYRMASVKGTPGASVSVNGEPVARLDIQKGYARVTRQWKKGDVIELNLPMPVRRVYAHEKVKDDAGRVAIQRGPIVYCLEGVDNGKHLGNLYLPPDAKLAAEHRGDLLGGATVIKGKATVRRDDGDDTPTDLLAVPYYAWDHREAGPMMVWIPEKRDASRPVPKPTIASESRASASHASPSDAASAMNDQIEPANSIDHGVSRLTWWDHRGTTEWVQYDFAKPAKVSSVEVYWFDDTGRGACRVPKSWRVLYRAGGKWKPVTGASACGVEKDKFNRATFDAVETDGLRLEVELQPKVSGGILEWRVGKAE